MKYISQFAFPQNSSGAANITGTIFPVESCTTLSLVQVSTGAVGSLQIQVSNDPVEQTNQVVNWASPTGAYVLAVSAASTTATSIPDFCWKWMRVVYTFTSGSGNITASVKSDGF